MLARPLLVPRQILSQLQIQVGRARIPRIILGTSPFIGASQFGSRAAFYHSYFYWNPQNIAKIIFKAVDLGVMGVQVLPHRPIFDALKIVERELKERLIVVGTVGPDDPVGNMEDFQRFNTIAMLLHAQITDERNVRTIKELLNRVHMANCLAGLTTHKPLPTLNWLLKTDLDIDILMLPFNRLGMFMDAPPIKVAGVIKQLGKPVVGKKVLAAGRLNPRDALTYAARLGCLDVVALGVASVEEAMETFTAAAEAFSGIISA